METEFRNRRVTSQISKEVASFFKIIRYKNRLVKLLTSLQQALTTSSGSSSGSGIGSGSSSGSVCGWGWGGSMVPTMSQFNEDSPVVNVRWLASPSWISFDDQILLQPFQKLGKVKKFKITNWLFKSETISWNKVQSFNIWNYFLVQG